MFCSMYLRIKKGRNLCFSLLYALLQPTYAFTVLLSTLALLYAGQSSLLLHDEKLIATKKEATATTKNALFIIKPIIL